MPFTREAFLDVFAAYNRLLWPFAAVLWVATAWATVELVRGAPWASRAIGTLLVTHWAWAGAIYHLVFFTRINPAAWMFAALFLLQACAAPLLLAISLDRGSDRGSRRPAFVRRPSLWRAPSAPMRTPPRGARDRPR